MNLLLNVLLFLVILFHYVNSRKVERGEINGVMIPDERGGYQYLEGSLTLASHTDKLDYCRDYCEWCCCEGDPKDIQCWQCDDNDCYDMHWDCNGDDCKPDDDKKHGAVVVTQTVTQNCGCCKENHEDDKHCKECLKCCKDAHKCIDMCRGDCQDKCKQQPSLCWDHFNKCLNECWLTERECEKKHDCINLE